MGGEGGKGKGLLFDEQTFWPLGVVEVTLRMEFMAGNSAELKII